MTTPTEVLDALNGGPLNLEAESKAAESQLAFLQDLLTPGTGRDLGHLSAAEFTLAPDVIPQNAAVIIAGIGDLALR